MSADVDVVDLRPGSASGTTLDALTAASRVVVVDRSEHAGDNHAHYQRIATIGQVREILLVLVGPIATDEDGRAVLRQSAMLGAQSTTLWVGDERGSRWEGGTDHGRQPESDAADAVEDLLEVLRSRRVFDEVVGLVRRIPFQAACPALDVVHPSVRPAELTSLLRRALRQLSGVDDGPAAADEPTPPVVATAAAAVTPGSRLDQARSAARQRLAAAVRATADLRRWNGPWSPGGAATRDLVAAADTAVERHRTLALEAVALAERLPVPDDAALEAVGVPRPHPVDHGAVAAAMRGLLESRLHGGSLPLVGRSLRQLANRQAHHDADTRAVAARVVLEQPVPKTAWPAVLAVLPVALATCFIAAGQPSAGTIAGPALAVLWLGLAAVLLSRRPPGGPPTAPAVGGVAVAAAAGTALGLLGPVWPALPTAGEAAVVTACALVPFAALGALWRAQVDRWTASLALAAGQALTDRLAVLVDRSVVTRQATADLRRRTADAALLLAGGCDDVRDVFAATCADGPVDEEPPTGHHHDLLEVIHRDLELIGTAALEDCLDAIASGAPLTADAGLVASRARDLTKEYVEYLGRSGVHRRPPVGDADARRDLEAAFWEDSAHARRVLKATGREEMRQLCHVADLRRLNSDWSGVGVVRFAPEHVRDLFGVMGEEIVDTDRDVVGVLRLVPLRPGVVRRVQPTASGHDTRSDR